MGALSFSFPLLVLWGLAGLPADLLTGYRSESGPWGTVHQKGIAGESGRAAGEIAAALARVEGRLGLARGRPFEAVLTPDPREFARLFRAVAGRGPDSWISGVAFPGQDLLLVRGDVFPVLKAPGDRPAAVLEHELAHLVLHADPGLVIPRWFDEGAAMWAARQSPDPDDEAFLSALARLGALRSLVDLDREMPSSHDLASLAYQESYLAVEWLAGRFGPRWISGTVARMKEGLAFEKALEGVTGRSLADLQGDFRLWLKGRRSIWEAIASSVSLWTVVSILAVLAIARSLVRRRRALRKMAEKEREEEANPYHLDAP